jgi:hypothetical protein
MDVADYFRLRDAAVLAGGQEFHRFLVSQGRYKSPEQEEITLHKMRTAGRRKTTDGGPEIPLASMVKGY